MSKLLLTRWLWYSMAFVSGLVVILPSADAQDLCSDRKVKRLSKSGKTVSYIAKTCEMSADDVRDILEEEEEEDPEPTRQQSNGQSRSKGGIPSGTPLAPCACWGYVSPGHRQANPSCSSGVAVAQLCTQLCPAGGYAWRGVCE